MSYSGVVPAWNSSTAASMPTTWNETIGPVGGGPAPVALLTASDWEAAYILIRRTVPMPTPLSRCRLKEASTSSGDDGSGILPATRLTVRDISLGGTYTTLKLLLSIGCVQAHAGGPL